MMARILPLRLAAPVGSAVARACVAMFIAAKDNPHSSRVMSKLARDGISTSTLVSRPRVQLPARKTFRDCCR
jgi:hypothetical protein